MPPVPKVILARPGRTQPWPIERRLLVADERGDRRRAVEGGGRRRRSPERVDDASGSNAPGMRSGVEDLVVPVGAVAAHAAR